MKLLLPLVVLGTIVAACAVPEPRFAVSPDDTSWIEPGVTTKQEVIKRLGEPTSSAQLLTSEVLRYGASPEPLQPASVPSVVATPRGYMSVESPPIPQPTVRERVLWIRFDERGIVSAIGYDEPTAR